MMPNNKHSPLCPICNELVELEKSKTDEHGKAVHEDCYIAAIKGSSSPDSPKKTDSRLNR